VSQALLSLSLPAIIAQVVVRWWPGGHSGRGGGGGDGGCGDGLLVVKISKKY
jgi:hypothetical protein